MIEIEFPRQTAENIFNTLTISQEGDLNQAEEVKQISTIIIVIIYLIPRLTQITLPPFLVNRDNAIVLSIHCHL